jgi:hypothetical protein
MTIFHELQFILILMDNTPIDGARVPEITQSRARHMTNLTPGHNHHFRPEYRPECNNCKHIETGGPEKHAPPVT